MMPDSVDLTIEELALHGLEPADSELIGRQLEHQLARLFAERGLPAALASGGDWPALDGLSFQLEPGAGADALATQVARALYGGLAR
jgi:hypothetical protein